MTLLRNRNRDDVAEKDARTPKIVMGMTTKMVQMETKTEMILMSMMRTVKTYLRVLLDLGLGLCEIAAQFCDAKKQRFHFGPGAVRT